MALKDLSVAERLEDLPRPGKPRRMSADQICRIEQLACEKPEQSGRPISQCQLRGRDRAGRDRVVWHHTH